MTMDMQIDVITGLTESDRKKIFSWIASLSEELAIDIFQDAVKKSFQLKEQNPGILGKTIKYCAFVLAARNAGWDSIQGKGYRVAGQKQFDDFSHMRKAKAAAFIKKGRTPVTRRKVLAHWGEVLELKAEGMGFRPIADYLCRKRKVKTSATYLAKLWKEL